MKCFYHNDADGKAAAHILLGGKSKMDCISMDYNKRFPIEDIGEDEVVYIVDFSIDPEMMRKLCDRTENVVWIDHHVSAIEKLVDYSWVEGLRSVDYSGCELTWLWFNTAALGHNVAIEEYQFDMCPRFIRLIGDRDTWKFKFGDEANWFNEAFKMAGSPEPYDFSSWDDLMMNVDEKLKEGKLLCKHTDMVNESISKGWSYEAMFEGHKILVCNAPIFTSELFGNRLRDYPFVAVYCHNGENIKVSLYSVNMDVVDFATKHGGGGHPRACGFVCNEIPFRRL